MLALRIDASGPYDVRWPRAHADVIALARAYVKYEQDAGAEVQLAAPALSQVQEALEAAETAVSLASGGESARAAAAETYRQSLATAKPLLDRAITLLKAKHFDNLAELEEWGLHTKNGRSGVSVLKPEGDSGWVEFLQAYVAREKDLDAEKRLADPPYDTMAELDEKVRSSIKARDAGRSDRESNVAARIDAVDTLLDLVQVAAVVITVTRFQGRVSKDLLKWGFDVVEEAPAPAVTEG